MIIYYNNFIVLAAYDLVNLFTNPDQWAGARSLVNTYVFYEQNLVENCATFAFFFEFVLKFLEFINF